MNFDYNVKIRALGAEVKDNSFYSAVMECKYQLENVALLSYGANIEIEKSYRADTDPNNLAKDEDLSKIIDGKDNTQWQAAKKDSNSSFLDDTSFIITLDNVYTIYGFHLYWQNSNAAEYDIEYSLDGIEWFTAAEYRQEKLNGARHDYLYLNEPIQAQFIRFQGVRRSTQWGYNCYTFEVYSM